MGGMMTQVDEVQSSRFQEMSFMEFQHAIGAVVFLREGFVASRMPDLLEEFFVTKLFPILPDFAKRTTFTGSPLKRQPSAGAALASTAARSGSFSAQARGS